jgi:hypothetical protein
MAFDDTKTDRLVLISLGASLSVSTGIGYSRLTTTFTPDGVELTTVQHLLIVGASVVAGAVSLVLTLVVFSLLFWALAGSVWALGWLRKRARGRPRAEG